MSKPLEALAALLVKGARVTLNAFTIDGVKAVNSLVGREQLVVDVDEKGGVTLITSDPRNAGEMGRRYWATPKPAEVEVKGDSFTLTNGTGSKENPKLVYQYSVVKPPVEASAAEPAKAAAAPAPVAPEEPAGKQTEAEQAKV